MGIVLQRDLLLSAPLLVVALGSLVVLLLEVFIKREWPRVGVVTAVLLFAFFCMQCTMSDLLPRQTVLYGFFYADLFGMFVNSVIIFGSILALWMGAGRLKHEGVETPGEYYSLFLMCTAGAMMFASSAELLSLFIGLEIMSMALYCLCGSNLGSQRSSEAALKYFFLGSFASAFLLYGIALLYGLTGTTIISEIIPKLGGVDGPLLYIAMGLMLIGLIFKVGAVPFHFWAPDVYQGAPTPITAYMACIIKAAAVAAALRIIWTLFYGAELIVLWSGILWFVAFLTMILGNLLALRQRSLKRMLAYSSIAHAGYILVAFLAPTKDYGGGAAILYYLVAYTVMTLGAFGVVMVVTSHYANQHDPDDITRFNRLGNKQPVLAAMMALFMLALCGLPPGMAGLLGKFYIFNAAIKAGYVGLAIVGVLCSAVSCYYYLRVVVAMYFLPEEEGVEETVISSDFLSVWAIRLCAVAVIVIGVFPSVIHGSAAQIMARF
ncbi:NADH-quinone oxidoreductase subunit N [Oligoflexia bacterium]|nr:NADH-quinone oxidoreductase subunit N [Oligoflexia bacterium]